jgi:peptidoglycan/LPS O-acetylase OafA/YrhL
MARSHEAYRPEIDGLRAVAVLPVIAFHAGFPWLPGGFLGVDIFFVISGYLICRILHDELQAGTFSILGFYERRARRILPALLFMIICTAPVAFYVLPPDLLKIYFGSVSATALFYSNIFFWNTIDYFRPDAELQPLLHTWSLSVEEQFYIVFPILLFLAHKFLRSRLAAVVWLSAVAFFFVFWFQREYSSEAAFYLLHARAWELLTGAGLALSSAALLKFAETLSKSRILSTSGLIAIAIAMLAGPAHVPLELVSALAVLGTACIIAFARPGDIVHSILSFKPMVGLGLLSYSAYLWHQPLFAFVKNFAINEPPRHVFAALILLTLAIAFLSWLFVEAPFRSRKFLSRNTVLISAIAALGTVSVVSFALRSIGAYDFRLSPETVAFVSPPQNYARACTFFTPLEDHPKFELCKIGAETGTAPIVLWGDSHAEALLGELGTALEKQGLSGLYVKNDNCLRIPGIVTAKQRTESYSTRCAATAAAAFRYLAEQKPKAIIAHMRWTFRLFPIDGKSRNPGFDNREGGKEYESERQYWAKDSQGVWSISAQAKADVLVKNLKSLAAIAPLVVVGPVPEVGWHVGQLNFKKIILRGEAPSDITTSLEVFRQRNQFVSEIFEKVRREIGFKFVEPSLFLCNTSIKSRCTAQTSGTALYADDDHLSDSGARPVIAEIMTLLK